MSDQDPRELAFETLAVRAGQHRTAEQEHAEPIFPTSSYVFDSAADARARFAGETPGNIYSRFTNPTVRAFEERLAVLEGGERCVATASGMSAIYATCAGLLKAGDHVVCSRSVFGSTTLLFNNFMSRFSVETRFVALDDLRAWEQAIQPNTRMLFLETPSNPLTEVADIRALADIAHAHDCILVVDNCFCTPALQRPLDLGADIVIHSATKYLDGQGRCIGGAVVGGEELVGQEVYAFLRTCGPSMSPFNAWVFLKGLETLAVRMRAHCDSAHKMAGWLEERPGISRVYYPGLISHAQHELAGRQQRGYGGIVAFEVEGGREAAWQLIDATRICSITANLGDTRTTITHPATTTHGRLSEQQLEEAGISQGLVRVAVGLENIDDLCADLERGLP